MAPRKRLSIATLLAIELLVTVTLILSITGAAALAVVNRQTRADFLRRGAIQADALVPALSLPLWNLDAAQVDQILRSAMLDRNVQQIWLQWDGGPGPEPRLGRDRQWQPVPMGSKEPAPPGVRLDRLITFAGHPLATLSVVRSTRFLDQASQGNRRLLLLCILFVDVALVGLVYLSLHLLILKPLKAIHAIAQRMKNETGPGRDDETIFFPEELGSLRLALLEAIDLLKARYEERRDQEIQSQHTQRLESLGRLSGGIAHDMNNVLAAIMAVTSSLLAKPKLDPATTEALGLVLQASVRGRDLVKGLSQFVRKELESIAVLNFNDLVQREYDLLRHTTLSRVAFSLDLDPNLETIRGDASHLGNALMNLCVNALDAMPNGGQLSFRTRNLGQGWIECQVIDTGEGMPPEVAAKAVEPFFTTKARGKGTGLGLSSVFGTVQSHRGTMAITSRPGEGTTISLRFPTAAAPLELNQVMAEPDSNALSVKSRILLIDDEELLLETSRLMLEGLGHLVETAASGMEGLRVLGNGNLPDLVMLDQNMPGLTGMETLVRIRLLHPQIPVLMASGYLLDSDLAALARDPRVLILFKPFSRDELERKLAEVASKLLTPSAVAVLGGPFQERLD